MNRLPIAFTLMTALVAVAAAASQPPEQVDIHVGSVVGSQHLMSALDAQPSPADDLPH